MLCLRSAIDPKYLNIDDENVLGVAVRFSNFGFQQLGEESIAIEYSNVEIFLATLQWMYYCEQEANILKRKMPPSRVKYSHNLRKIFADHEIFAACKNTNFLFVKNKDVVRRVLEWTYHPLYAPPLRLLFRSTIYPHFCEGADALSCTKTIAKYLSSGIHSMIDIAREDEECEEACRSNTRAKIALFETISNTFPRGSIKFLPIKVSGVIPLNVLLRAAHVLDTLTYEVACTTESLPLELNELVNARSPLVSICHTAQQHGIRVLLDAEPSHVQPVIEFLGHCLCRQFNTSTAVVYSTYQCYLTRTPQHLQRDLHLSQRCNYVFAVKLVRGAYLRSETERACTLRMTSPLVASKADVDNAYNHAMHSLLLDIAEQKRVAVMIATHNRDSVEHAVCLMSSLRLSPTHPNIDFAMIKGINTHLAYILAKRRYNVSLLLMCGEFDILFPWLTRRLDENQDMFGAAQQEYKWYELTSYLMTTNVR